MAASWRPDPAAGVFETLLILDGRPVEWDAHMARLHAGLATLYPHLTPPPLDAPGVTGPYASSTPGRSVEALRIAVAPGAGGDLATTVARRPATGHSAPDDGGRVTSEAVSLRSLTLPGGLGAHKWVDRSLLDEAQSRLPDDTLPLILDEDDAVLEASRANLFAVRDGALFTPPLDGRILPGVTRARVLELAASLGIWTHETALRRDDLRAADEVFLSGSVRGIEPVTAIDGAALAGVGEIAGRIGGELHRVWGGMKTAATFG